MNTLVHVLVAFKVDVGSAPEKLGVPSEQQGWMKSTFGSQKRRSMPCWHRTTDLGLSSSNSRHTTWNTKVCPHSRRQASWKQITAHCPSPSSQNGLVAFHGEQPQGLGCEQEASAPSCYSRLIFILVCTTTSKFVLFHGKAR